MLNDIQNFDKHQYKQELDRLRKENFEFKRQKKEILQESGANFDEFKEITRVRNQEYEKLVVLLREEVDRLGSQVREKEEEIVKLQEEQQVGKMSMEQATLDEINIKQKEYEKAILAKDAELVKIQHMLDDTQIQKQEEQQYSQALEKIIDLYEKLFGLKVLGLADGSLNAYKLKRGSNNLANDRI
jgi:hypothetical protein